MNNLYEDIALFIKVVDIGSFLHTAKVLKVTHSTISRRIKALEENLKTTLILRDTKNFVLTDNGQKIYNEFKPQIDKLDISINNVLTEENEPSGTINVLLPPAFSFNYINEYIPEFLRKYPKIDIHLTYTNKDASLIKDGYDIAIINHFPKLQTPTIKLLYCAMVSLYCTQKYANKYGIPKTPEDLSKHLVTGNLLFDNTVPTNFELKNLITGQTTIIPMPRRLTINSMLQNSKFLHSNEVICGFFNNTSFDTEVIQVLPEYSILEIKFYILRHPQSNDKKVSLFYDFIQQKMKNLK